MKDDTVVGHVLHEKSHIVWYFIKHDGIVNCQVTEGNLLLSVLMTDKVLCKCKLYMYA